MGRSMERFGAFWLGLPEPEPPLHPASLASLRTRLFLVAFVLFLIPASVDAQDLQIVDDALPDFTAMSIEDLVQQDMTVRERLPRTRFDIPEAIREKHDNSMPAIDRHDGGGGFVAFNG